MAYKPVLVPRAQSGFFMGATLDDLHMGHIDHKQIVSRAFQFLNPRAVGPAFLGVLQT